MPTEFTQQSFPFQPLSKREVVARFDGGKITSDAGALLLRETERATGILRQFTAQTLYEEEYCARGEMVNQIKEQQLCLFADRTSAATMRANELRLWFSSTG